MGDAVALHDLQHRCLVAEVHFLERIFGVIVDFRQVCEMARVGKAIEIHQPLDFGVVNDMMDEIGSNKPGAASDEEFHAICINQSSGLHNLL